MRKEKALVTLLRSLVDLLSREAERSPEFARELEDILQPLPSRKTTTKRIPLSKLSLPDVYREFASRGEVEFSVWLQDKPIEILRSIIRGHDLDATRRTSKWKDARKLSVFITEQIRARMARGSSFLSSSSDEKTSG